MKGCHRFHQLFLWLFSLSGKVRPSSIAEQRVQAAPGQPFRGGAFVPQEKCLHFILQLSVALQGLCCSQSALVWHLVVEWQSADSAQLAAVFDRKIKQVSNQQALSLRQQLYQV